MTMRMAGISGMFDTEALVTQTMQPYKLKVTNKVKQRDLLSLQQTQYRNVIKESTDFYNKYFKVGSSGLLSASNYQSLTFTPSVDGKVTAKAGSSAVLDNYKVSVKQIATASSAYIEKSSFLNADGTLQSGKNITVNGQAIPLSGANTTEIVNNLNDELTKRGINASAKYTDFATNNSGSNISALVLQSKTLGKDGTISVGLSFSDASSVTSTMGTDAVAAKTQFAYSALTASATSKVTINGADIEYNNTDTIDDILAKISKTVNDLDMGISVKLDGTNILLETTNTGGTANITTSIGGGASTTEYGTNGTKSMSEFSLSEIGADSSANITELNKQIIINGKVIKFDASDNDVAKRIQKINDQSGSTGVNAVLDTTSTPATLKFTSTSVGANAIKVSSSTGGTSGLTPIKTEDGKDADVTITNGAGVVYNYKGSVNNLTLDGVGFTFTGSTYTDPSNSSTDTPVTLTGKTDVTALKDKIVKFINDYNTLITDLNTKLSEKRDKSYMPLSSDEKKDMNADDIKLWNDKVNQGLIRKDNDVQRLANDMKSAMRTMMAGTGLKLESIGISPVDDYTTLDGTYEVDDDKLTTALQNNMDGVKDLFLKESSGNSTYQDGGIITNLKSTLYAQIVNYTTSPLIKKAGYSGSVSDDISLQLSKMQNQIDEMNADLDSREQTLYSKYANLESAMSKLQAQQQKLSSQFGS